MKRYRKPYRVKIKKKKSILKNRFFWFGFLVLIILAVSFYFLFFYKFFQIEKNSIEGAKKVSRAEIESILQKEITKKFLFFQTKSIFLLKSDRAEEIILRAFPQIDKVAIKKIFPDALDLEISEKNPVAFYCLEHCFLIDREGIIFEEISLENFESKDFLKIQLTENKKIGENIIKKELLAQILDIAYKLKMNLKIEPEYVSMVSEDKIIFKTKIGFEIYFDSKADINWQITKLQAVLAEKIPESEREKLEYIDLRFGNLAPYKYR